MHHTHHAHTPRCTKSYRFIASSKGLMTLIRFGPERPEANFHKSCIPKKFTSLKNQKARYGFFFIGLLEAVSMVIYIKHKVQKGDRAPRPILQRLRAQIQQ